MRAGGDQVGLDKAIVGWPGRGEGGDVIVPPIIRGIGVGEGAHSDHVGVVPGHTDAQRPRAVIAGRDHHQDALRPGGHQRLVDRIQPIGRLHRGRHGEVNDPDAVLVFVVEHPLDPEQGLFVGAPPVLIGDAHPHQVHARCDAAVFTVGADFTVGDNTADVSSVAVWIGGFLLPIDKVHPTDDALVIPQALGQPFVIIDPRIDHGHSDARAVISGRPYCIGPDRIGVIGYRVILVLLAALIVLAAFVALFALAAFIALVVFVVLAALLGFIEHRAIEGHLLVGHHRPNLGVLRQPGGGCDRKRGPYAVNNLQPGGHRSAILLHQVGDRGSACALYDVRSHLRGSRLRFGHGSPGGRHDQPGGDQSEDDHQRDRPVEIVWGIFVRLHYALLDSMTFR